MSVLLKNWANDEELLKSLTNEMQSKIISVDQNDELFKEIDLVIYDEEVFR